MLRLRLIENWKFNGCWDRDQSRLRLSKRCRYRDSIKTLADLCSVVFFSHRRSTPIKKSIYRKLTGAPKNLQVDPFPDLIGHFGAPMVAVLDFGGSHTGWFTMNDTKTFSNNFYSKALFELKWVSNFQWYQDILIFSFDKFQQVSYNVHSWVELLCSSFENMQNTYTECPKKVSPQTKTRSVFYQKLT